MRILMVLTSNDQMGDTGKKTGFWLEEFAAPYYHFLDNGAGVAVASPKGGRPPVDPNSEKADALSKATRRLKDDAEAQAQLDATKRLSEVDAADYDAIFYPGGHGPLWDLVENTDSIRLIEAFAAASKPVGAVCHGPAVLKNPKLNGQPLVSGRPVTGFSNSEEKAMKLEDAVPFLLEDMLRGNGGDYAKGADWSSFVQGDDLLVTGQNPASSEETAKRFFALLNS